MRPLVIMTVIAFAAVLVTASAPVHMASAAPLTRAACEAAGSFIWIEAGPFVSGSDTAERDAAYTVSAQAASATPAEVAGNEQNLRERA